MSELGESVNPYAGLKCLSAKDPQELCDLINQIKAPIKIITIVESETKSTVYFQDPLNGVKLIKRSK